MSAPVKDPSNGNALGRAGHGIPLLSVVMFTSVFASKYLWKRQAGSIATRICSVTLALGLLLHLSCTSPPSDGEWQGKLDFKFPIPTPLHVKFTVTDRGRTVRNLNVAGQDITGVFKIEGREFVATATNGATIRGKFDGQNEASGNARGVIATAPNTAITLNMDIKWTAQMVQASP
jgi:hypothetical protein